VRYHERGSESTSGSLSPPFWILFRPGLGYYCPDGEAPKAAVFLRSDFHREIESISLQRGVTNELSGCGSAFCPPECRHLAAKIPFDRACSRGTRICRDAIVQKPGDCDAVTRPIHHLDRYGLAEFGACGAGLTELTFFPQLVVVNTYGEAGRLVGFVQPIVGDRAPAAESRSPCVGLECKCHLFT
jgi:hypothetical protein